MLAEAAQPGAQLDGDAKAGQPLAQDLLDPPLGDHQADRIRDVRRGHVPGLGVGRGDHLRPPVLAEQHVGDPGGQDPVDHPEVVEHLQAARAQPLAAGTGRELRDLVDDAHGDAAPGKITRERQAGRAGPHHEDICLRHVPMKTLLS